jgi:hypothetical protein
MENEFDEVMRNNSDAELINILEGPPDNYQPLALESAKREFKRRNLSKGQINTAKQVNVQRSQIDEAKANESLPVIWKILAIIFPGIIQIMFAGTYKADGYERKSKELLKWSIYGGIFYLGLTIFFIIVNTISHHF